MDTLTFLRTVLGADGYYCVFATQAGRRKQKFFTRLEEVASVAMALSDAEYNAYFALATFTVDTDRKADHAHQLKALFLDLDCGPKKGYPDQAAAIRDLQRFARELELPRPLLVNSGWGVHVYWPLAEAVPVSEWLPVAEALKRACAAHGLLADPAITSDAARVLRVPGTQNYKHEDPAPVVVLGHPAATLPTLSAMRAKLATYTAPAPVPRNTALSAADDPVMQRLMGSRTNSFRRILERTSAGQGCAHLAHAVAHPDATDEPLWRAALSITKFCTEGAKAAHKISRGHPEYDAEETDAKLDGIKGPYTCSTFNDLRPGICASCQHWSKITSPIQLGAEIAAAEEIVEAPDKPGGSPTVVYAGVSGSIPRYPYPYFRGKAGGVYVKEDKDDGTTVDKLIYLNDLYYTKRVVDPEAGECLIGRLHLPNDLVREFVVPLVAATARDDLRKALSKYGVSVPAKHWDNIMSYTNKWIEELQVTTEADTARTQFGWVEDRFNSYVIGEREIFADRVGFNPPSAKTAFLFPAFRVRGTLEGWIEQAKFYDRPGLEPYQYVICNALAAPLMRFTPINATIFDLYSDGSGHGKSTTQKFAATIYGSPSELVMGPRDTLLMRMNRLELMKDVNVQFDEFTEFPAADTPDLVYNITDGKQRGRLKSGSNEERYRGSPWHTTVCSSSNHSMLAKVYAAKANPRAEVQRVLRYHVQPFNFTDKRETDLFAKSVGDHVGHAVQVFVQKIMQDTATVKSLIETVQGKIDAACGLTMQNRFWSVQGAVTLAALILARDIGLLSYDPKALFNWVVDLINTNKAEDAAAVVTIDSVINDFINDHYGAVLWIKSTDDLRGKVKGPDNPPALDNLVIPEHAPKVKLVARFETDIRRLCIGIQPLKTWCLKQRLNHESVLKEMVDRGARREKVRMGKGTKLDLPPMHCVTLLLTDSLASELERTREGATE